MSFSFHDLLDLRKAHSWIEQRLSPRRMQRTLRAIRNRLGPEIPLLSLKLSNEGQEILVEENGVKWNVLSGQLLFPFEPVSETQSEGQVVPIGQERAKSPHPTRASERSIRSLYEEACALESSAPEEAKSLYQLILNREPGFADAHVNLGRLMHESSDLYAALIHYRAALSIRPRDPTAAFNCGVALEDLGAQEEAIAAYRHALACEPRYPDAHYNLARLLEQTGKPDLAVRHLLLYRQLVKKP